MDDRTRRALDRATEHWKRLVAGDPNEPGPGSDSCALCDLYCDEEDCDGCPVARAGHVACEGTPYEWAQYQYNRCGPQSDEFKAAAQMEVEFLESLK